MTIATGAPSATDVRWLDPEEQRTWRLYMTATKRLAEILERELNSETEVPHSYYEVLVRLSEAPARTLRMSELADNSLSSRSRLSHAVTRMEEKGWVVRESCPSDGRGFNAHISTERDVPLPDSACVYCGNCIAVCPTGALMATPEFELRKAGEWRPETQAVTDTICPYCGVGCTLTVHVQDQQIVKITSPFDNDVTRGNLCVKGRFGFEYVNK